MRLFSLAYALANPLGRRKHRMVVRTRSATLVLPGRNAALKTRGVTRNAARKPQSYLTGPIF